MSYSGRNVEDFVAESEVFYLDMTSAMKDNVCCVRRLEGSRDLGVLATTLSLNICVISRNSLCFHDPQCTHL